MKTPVGSRLTAGSMPRIGIPRGPGGSIEGIIAPHHVHNVTPGRSLGGPAVWNGSEEGGVRNRLCTSLVDRAAQAQWLNFQARRCPAPQTPPIKIVPRLRTRAS